MTESRTETAAAVAVIQRLSLQSLAELLRRAGYRASIADDGTGRLLVQSAAQGMGFVLIAGNPDSSEAGSYVDFSFNCLIRTEQPVAPALIDRWNEGKRFARCFQREGLLALVLDVMLVGGVSDRYLLSQCELWDRLLHDFIAHLRQPVAPAVIG